MNGDLNSHHSDFLSDMVSKIILDLAWHFSLSDRHIKQDLNTINTRVKHEGLSFFTKTLPTLGKLLDKALLTGQLTPSCSFKRKKNSNSPLFLNGLYELIFRNDGSLLETPDEAAIAGIRQVAFVLYKYELPHKDSAVEQTISDFIEVESNMKPFRCKDANDQSLFFYSQEVINEIFQDFVPDFHPKNGPGSTADGSKPWERFEPSTFYPDLNKLFSYEEGYYYNSHTLFDNWEDYFNLPIVNKGLAKLVDVPKDSRGPRLISMEPKEYMFYEQSMAKQMMKHLERHKLTREHVNFSSQDINRTLCLKGSIDGLFCTLDLSAASDRLSKGVVDLLFEDTYIHEYLLAARTSATKLPDGRVQFFEKYAPMGSALTFPVQSVSFFSLCVGALIREGIPSHKAKHMIWVYGDDIICYQNHVPIIMEALTSVGLKINEEKSCFTGYFRESCGCDAYKGIDITPIKVKKVIYKQDDKKKSKNDGELLSTLTDLSNRFHDKCFRKTADFLRSYTESIFGNLPRVSKDSQALGFTYKNPKENPKQKYNHHLQCKTLKVPIIETKKINVLLSGWERLMNFALNKSEELDYFPTDCFSPRNQVRLRRVNMPLHFV